MLIRIFIIIFFIFINLVKVSYAFWVWTPETNRWENPKYSVKETPAEQLEFAKTFYTSKEYERAMLEFKKLIKHYPRAKEAAEAQYSIGMCLEALGKPLEAFKAYQVVIEKYPFSDLSMEIIKRQYAIGNNFLEGQNKRGKFSSVVLGNDYDVIEVFRTVIKNAPYGEYAAPSQYKIALYLHEKHLYEEARDEFEKVMNDYPDSEWAKAAQYQIALADAKRSTSPQYDQEVTKAATQEFKEFVKVYPEAELSQEAQKHIEQLNDKEAENNFLIGQFYEKQKEYQSAKIYYNTVVEDFADTQWASKALVKLRELSLKDNKRVISP